MHLVHGKAARLRQALVALVLATGNLVRAGAPRTVAQTIPAAKPERAVGRGLSGLARIGRTAIDPGPDVPPRALTTGHAPAQGHDPARGHDPRFGPSRAPTSGHALTTGRDPALGHAPGFVPARVPPELVSALGRAASRARRT